MPLTTATSINHIPFAFDLMTLLPAAHLTELLFSLLVQVTSTLSCDWSTTLTSVLCHLYRTWPPASWPLAGSGLTTGPCAGTRTGPTR